MKRFKKRLFSFILIISFGLIPAITCQFFTREPTDKNIHIRNFRYGKDPSVIRCNRGDRLHLTFSTEDTGHSFFLEEFDMDVKVSPASDEVSVFKTTDPTKEPVIAKEVSFTAEHPGLLNYIVSKSNYRCHVWCGPMHAFEQGKLVIFPNTLLFFSLGCLIGILFLWLRSVFRNPAEPENPKITDLLEKSGFLQKIILSRWPQIILTILALVMMYMVIMISIFGTKVSGRNLGVLMMWAVWLFLLVAILTPLFGRSWCTICPLPFFGDWLQRRSLFSPERGQTKGYHNRFYGLFLKWPDKLKNSWLRLIVFLILSTFSTTLVAMPWVSGLAILMLLLVPTLMSFIWELRAFCRYVCPVSVFVAPFSEMSTVTLKNKSQSVCDKCKPHFCQKGSPSGWACPYGLNVGEMKDNNDCGLCLECVRSCSYKNVSLFRRPFGSESVVRSLSEAWLTIAIFTIAIVYSVLYLGVWPVVRDYVNILDKQNWDLFGIYSLIVWILVLVIVPAILYALAFIGRGLSKITISTKDVFLAYTGVLLPLGLMLWIAFVIPMLFVNITFIAQSASDPFGWGWDFFGTANIPWHQFLPQYVPWFQAFFILTGTYFSLKNLRKKWLNFQMNSNQLLKISLPIGLFLISVTVFMLFFFTN
ncbi:MAG: 4Fe-4S binding protein [Prolixibacteraceae bacterium]|nr:4Fe-4S binding protein [Prolixibacteraceae bacterium]